MKKHKTKIRKTRNVSNAIIMNYNSNLNSNDNGLLSPSLSLLDCNHKLTYLTQQQNNLHQRALSLDKVTYEDDKLFNNNNNFRFDQIHHATSRNSNNLFQLTPSYKNKVSNNYITLHKTNKHNYNSHIPNLELQLQEQLSKYRKAYKKSKKKNEELKKELYNTNKEICEIYSYISKRNTYDKFAVILRNIMSLLDNNINTNNTRITVNDLIPIIKSLNSLCLDGIVASEFVQGLIVLFNSYNDKHQIKLNEHKDSIIDIDSAMLLFQWIKDISNYIKNENDINNELKSEIESLSHSHSYYQNIVNDICNALNIESLSSLKDRINELLYRKAKFEHKAKSYQNILEN